MTLSLGGCCSIKAATVTFFLVNLCSLAIAYPTFRSLIPNGNQVPNPCDRTKTWAGVGHTNVDGGSEDLNPFGRDLRRTNYTWTPALCRSDSDGDGMTNGAELGDPDCVWVTGAGPAMRDIAQLSHPGICEPIDSAKCAGRNLFLRSICPNNLGNNTWQTSSLVVEPPQSNCIRPDRMPPNAYVTNNSPSLAGGRYAPGDFIQYECNIGYKMTGTSTMYCLRDGTWTDQPSCDVPAIIALSAGSCPAMIVPDNGFIARTSTQQSGNRYSSGDTVEYACNPGFTLFGAAVLTCRINGSWSAPRPNCTQDSVIPVVGAPTSCLSPPIPTNAYISNRQPLQIYPRYAIGDIIQYTCNSGYTISNRAGIQCMVDGSWYPSVPACIPFASRGVIPAGSCAKPTLPDNSFISTSPTAGLSDYYQMGTILQINCVSGYMMQSRFSAIQCMGDGFWQPSTFPECVRNIKNVTTTGVCRPPTPPDHGYIMNGQSPSPGGDFNFGMYTTGDEIIFGCIQGYKMTGEPVIRCQSDGTWLGNQLPTCNRAPIVDMSVMCTQPDQPANSVILSQTRAYDGGKYIVGSFFAFVCASGYGPSSAASAGRASILCQKDGTWTKATTFTCQRLPNAPLPNVTCLAPTPPDNAFVFSSSPSQGIPSRYALGDFIQYTCMDGFASNERPITICQQNGTFAPTVSLSCIRIARPLPGSGLGCISPAYGSQSHIVQISPAQINNRYNIGDSIQYACTDGYSTSDTTVIQCLSDQTWSGPLPTCQPGGYSGKVIACVPPTVPDNSYIMYSAPTRQFYSGDVIQYGCNAGYTVAGTSNRATCLQDGSWSAIYFTCQRNVRVSVSLTLCDLPPVPANGYEVWRSIQFTGTRFSPNDYIQYACNGGYRMVGNSTNICNRDGSWSGAPICMRFDNSRR